METGTRIRDQVTYSLPFGLFGNFAHSVWVKYRLNMIFDYRREKVAAIFG